MCNTRKLFKERLKQLPGRIDRTVSWSFEARKWKSVEIDLNPSLVSKAFDSLPFIRPSFSRL